MIMDFCLWLFLSFIPSLFDLQISRLFYYIIILVGEIVFLFKSTLINIALTAVSFCTVYLFFKICHQCQHSVSSYLNYVSQEQYSYILMCIYFVSLWLLIGSFSVFAFNEIYLGFNLPSYCLISLCPTCSCTFFSPFLPYF